MIVDDPPDIVLGDDGLPTFADARERVRQQIYHRLTGHVGGWPDDLGSHIGLFIDVWAEHLLQCDRALRLVMADLSPLRADLSPLQARRPTFGEVVYPNASEAWQAATTAFWSRQQARRTEVP